MFMYSDFQILDRLQDERQKKKWYILSLASTSCEQTVMFCAKNKWVSSVTSVRIIGAIIPQIGR